MLHIHTADADVDGISAGQLDKDVFQQFRCLLFGEDARLRVFHVKRIQILIHPTECHSGSVFHPKCGMAEPQQLQRLRKGLRCAGKQHLAVFHNEIQLVIIVSGFALMALGTIHIVADHLEKSLHTALHGQQCFCFFGIIPVLFKGYADLL